MVEYERSIVESWKKVWEDDRSYLKRLCLVSIPCFLIIFMYFVFEPFNIYFSNKQFFNFSFNEIVLPFLILGVIAFILASLLLALLKGHLLNLTVSLILGLAIASYIQGMVLNIDLGVLDGSSIAWHSYTKHSFFNLLIWFIIVLAPMAIYYFINRNWEKIIKAVSIVLIGVQIISFIVVVILLPAADKTEKYYLSGEEQFTVSSNKNVVVFVIDYFSNTYIEPLLEEYPNALDEFNDFTYYSNADCTYFGTFPSLNHMLSGNELDASIDTDEWFKQSWDSEKANTFYKTLVNNNYRTNVYSDGIYFGTAENMLGKVSNVERVTSKISMNYSSLIKKMVKLSCFKYVPHAMKASFWMDTNEFVGIATVSDTTVIRKDQDAFYSSLKTNKLSLNEEKNYFIVQHLRGTHPAYDIGPDGRHLDNATRNQTARGYFLMVEEYIRQMKELGVYDDSTIIITSDHGDDINSQVIYFIKEAGKSYDSKVSSAPISHIDFLPTILKSIGEDYSDFGRSIYDFEEDEKRERSVLVRSYNTGYPAVPKYNSSANGSSNVYNSYTYVGDLQKLLEQISKGPTEIIPMKESFF